MELYADGINYNNLIIMSIHDIHSKLYISIYIYIYSNEWKLNQINANSEKIVYL